MHCTPDCMEKTGKDQPHCLKRCREKCEKRCPHHSCPKDTEKLREACREDTYETVCQSPWKTLSCLTDCAEEDKNKKFGLCLEPCRKECRQKKVKQNCPQGTDKLIEACRENTYKKECQSSWAIVNCRTACALKDNGKDFGACLEPCRKKCRLEKVEQNCPKGTDKLIEACRENTYKKECQASWSVVNCQTACVAKDKSKNYGPCLNTCRENCRVEQVEQNCPKDKKQGWRDCKKDVECYKENDCQMVVNNGTTKYGCPINWEGPDCDEKCLSTTCTKISGEEPNPNPKSPVVVQG